MAYVLAQVLTRFRNVNKLNRVLLQVTKDVGSELFSVVD